jgi:hypothetical protein
LTLPRKTALVLLLRLLPPLLLLLTKSIKNRKNEKALARVPFLF